MRGPDEYVELEFNPMTFTSMCHVKYYGKRGENQILHIMGAVCLDSERSLKIRSLPKHGLRGRMC